jgi:hypothetical protein
MPTPTDLDPASWHRHFAMGANNRAWALAELPTRSADEAREMLSAAHASAWHWFAIGTELHRMRATMLLAQVHALVGDGPRAFAFASKMRAFFLEQPDTPDWELAFAHAIYAHAAQVAGKSAEHRASWQQARAALDAIADPEDRAIVEKTFAQVPQP